MTSLIRRTFAELLTFSRGSTATYFNASGHLVTAAVDEPRFDFDSLTKAPRGLLIEPTRTNLLLRSQEIQTGPWSTNNASRTGNALNAPDNTTTATRLTENSINAQHNTFQVLTLAAATDLVTSVFAKAGERSVITAGVASPGMTSIATRFDLTNSTILSGTGWIVPLKANWFWLAKPITTVTGGVSSTVWYLDNGTTTTYLGDGTSGAWLWGAQMEEGLFPTSYIPTTTAAVTRANESCTMALTDFWNASEGTIFVTADYIASSAQDTGSRYAVQLDDGTQDNRISVNNRSGTRNGAIVVSDTDTSCAFDGGVAGAGRCKIALSWQQDNFAFCVDGGAVVTDVAGILPLLTTLRLGHKSGAAGRLGGHVSVTYFPRASSAADLIDYTN